MGRCNNLATLEFSSSDFVLARTTIPVALDSVQVEGNIVEPQVVRKTPGLHDYLCLIPGNVAAATYKAYFYVEMSNASNVAGKERCWPMPS